MTKDQIGKEFPLGEKAADLNYSLRRFYVDQFHFRHVPGFNPGGRVLNLGGLRTLRRGVFRIDPYGFRVVHLNISARSKPEVVGDGAELPFPDNIFDAVLISEVLEHVPDPDRVLGEAARVLNRGGKILITVPFNNPIHADPGDFARYTDTSLRRNLDRAGLEPLVLEPQGHFLSVLADMLRDWLVHRRARGLGGRGLNRLATWGLVRLRVRAAERDESDADLELDYQRNYATGFGILARKP